MFSTSCPTCLFILFLRQLYSLFFNCCLRLSSKKELHFESFQFIITMYLCSLRRGFNSNPYIYHKTIPYSLESLISITSSFLYYNSLETFQKVSLPFTPTSNKFRHLPSIAISNMFYSPIYFRIMWIFFTIFYPFRFPFIPFIWQFKINYSFSV